MNFSLLRKNSVCFKDKTRPGGFVLIYLNNILDEMRTVLASSKTIKESEYEPPTLWCA